MLYPDEPPMTVEIDTTIDDMRALEALVVENQSLGRGGADSQEDEPEATLAQLEQLLAGFNLFEVLGNTRREERHSDFLAFLLSPSQPHGLGDAVLRAFIQTALEAEPEEPSGIRAIHAALLDLTDVRVERESNRIDILVTVDKERFVLLIENKVDTDEHSNQLQRYLDTIRLKHRDWSVLPVFLTRSGHTPTHPAYHPVSYNDVHRVLRSMLDRHRTMLTSDIEVVLRHYCEMLERHILEDTEIALLARKIYARHRRALDIIFEHRPDDQELLHDSIVAAITNDPALRLVYASKSSVQFFPVAWDNIRRLRSGGDGTWYKKKELLRFEFKRQGGLSLHLIVGPAKNARNRALLHTASGSPEHVTLFKGRSKTLSAKWCQLWTAPVLSKNQDSDLDVDAKVDQFQSSWVALKQTVLPQLIATVPIWFTDDDVESE